MKKYKQKKINRNEGNSKVQIEMKYKKITIEENNLRKFFFFVESLFVLKYYYNRLS